MTCTQFLYQFVPFLSKNLVERQQKQQDIMDNTGGNDDFDSEGVEVDMG